MVYKTGHVYMSCAVRKVYKTGYTCLVWLKKVFKLGIPVMCVLEKDIKLSIPVLCVQRLWGGPPTRQNVFFLIWQQNVYVFFYRLKQAFLYTLYTWYSSEKIKYSKRSVITLQFFCVFVRIGSFYNQSTSPFLHANLRSEGLSFPVWEPCRWRKPVFWAEWSRRQSRAVGTLTSLARAL